MGVQQEKNIIQIKRQFTLKVVSLACLVLCNSSAFAIGFGEVSLRSNLGDVLRVQIPVTGATEDVLVATCITSKIETLDGELVDVPHVDIVMPGRGNGLVNLNLVSHKIMSEPVVRLTVTMACGSTVHREYSLLLDYAEFQAAAPLPVEVSATQDTQVRQVAESQKAAKVPVPVKSHTVFHPPAPAQIETAAPEKPLKKEPSRHTAASGKDALHVASEDSADNIDLKMSQLLSSPAAPNADQLRLEENRQAQAQFAAILRGEDPAGITQTEIQKEQQKNKKLQTELDRLKQQNAQKDEDDKKSSPLLIGLIIAVTALLAALAGLVTVAVRRSRNSEDRSWWEAANEQKKNVVDIVDYLQNSAEQGDLDPGPITVVRDNGASESAVRPELVQPDMNHDEPAPKFKRMGLPALEDTNSSTFNFFGNRAQSIQIEEISDITQEAEFWMSVNDPHRAIEILEPQSRDENPTTPVTWLYLLDLYRMVGDEDNYRDLRQRFKHKFNAKIPNFHEEVVATSVRNFEDFPHLVSNCCALWKTEDIAPYLESLLVDDREGERMGFDLPVYRDILFLLAICSELKRIKYQSLANKEEVKITKKAAAVLTPIDDHLIVKAQDSDAGDLGNSLNFDLLDFKTGKDKKPE